MDTTPCQFCGATTQETEQTPTLFGVRALCAHCRPLYQAALADAFAAFHQRQRRTSPTLAVQPREAA